MNDKILKATSVSSLDEILIGLRSFVFDFVYGDL